MSRATRDCRPTRSAWSATSSSASPRSHPPTAWPPRWATSCSRSARRRRRCSCWRSSRCCSSRSPTRNFTGHPGLRHHIHVGHQGVRAVDRLDRRLGPGRVGDHRAGQRRRGRRHLPVQVPWPGLAGRIADRQGAAGLFLHHRHDADQRPRHRAVRTNPERADRNPVRRADHRQHHRADPGLHRHRRRAGDQPRWSWLWPCGLDMSSIAAGRHPVHLHLLGLGLLPGGRRGDRRTPTRPRAARR